MDNQTLTRPANICNFLLAVFETDTPTYASSRDYGFDFDEEEIGREMLAPLPVNLPDQPSLADVSDEFEARHLWFLA